MKQKEFEFIGKTLYLTKKRILVVGDLHLGYEYTFREPGSLIPATQFQETKNDLKKVFSELKRQGKKIKKVVFLGDVKHFFAYMKAEKNLFLNLLELVGKYVSRKNIIVLKGNHEKMAEIADKKLIDYYIEENIAFIHGDKEFKKIFEEGISTIIMGHLHPAITLIDRQKIKSEKYKCFMDGKYRGKKVIIVPSFLPTVEGTSVNEYLSDGLCIIPARNLKNFEVFIIGEKNVLDFGKLNKLFIHS
ncbi:MAG: metallophosphoesterase [Candidatus Pacearchaeota archaeon]